MASALPSTVQRKRAQASFPRRELHILLNGGPSHAALKEAVDAQLSRDEVFQSGPARVNASREEERQASAKVVTRLIQYLRQDDEETAQVRDRLMALAYPGAHSRISNHRDLFAPAIRGLGSAEQVQQWEPALRDFGVIGCFCMTELGHGSYARGIETTATYMPDTDQFDIHTPNETSAKVWIGSAGKTATHGVVFAQLVVAGKVLGLNAFIVPLRDMATGAALPGITAGDMGSKMGRNALDNGILWFSHVKVPRSALLCRYTKVDRQGGVTVSPLQQLSFFALVGGRIMMTHASSGYLSMATTIAVRYLAARRQFPAQDVPAQEQAQTHQLDPPPATGSGEAVVLDYPIQSRKMARMLARSVALHATGWALERVHEEVTATLAAAVRGTSNMSPAISALKMLHNLSAALKASTTWAACDGIDTCRQACGGVGYSSYSGLPGIQADMAVMPTWEGDNTLMCLQAGSFLLKSLRALSKGAEPSPALTWLPEALAQDTPFPESAAEYRLCKASTHEDIIQFVQRCVSGLRWCAAQGAMALASKLSRAELSPAEAAEDMVPMALAFADAFS
ncbi:POX2, partial [Symbiodinium sp. KB8]